MLVCAGPAQERGGSDGIRRAGGGPNEDERGGAAGEDEEEPGGFVSAGAEEGASVALCLLQQGQPLRPAGEQTLEPLGPREERWNLLLLPHGNSESAFCTSADPTPG